MNFMENRVEIKGINPQSNQVFLFFLLSDTILHICWSINTFNIIAGSADWLCTNKDRGWHFSLQVYHWWQYGFMVNIKTTGKWTTMIN